MRRIDRMLLGSVASVAFGLIAPQLVLAAWAAATGSSYTANEFLGIPLLTLAALIYVAPVWALVLIPLYLGIPQHSMLWRWPVCTACGALAGAGLAALLLSRSFSTAGAVIGGATCLFGSLTRYYFHRVDDNTRNAGPSRRRSRLRRLLRAIHQ